jgi:hypothetical protein
MKKNILLLTLVLFYAHTWCQIALPYGEARGIYNVKLLDSIHVSGMHVDSTQAAFWDRQDEFGKAYNDMLQQLFNYLNKNGFKFGKETRCTHKIYFEKDGTIKYYLYTFRDLNPAKEADFKKLLNEFIKTYKFPLDCKTPYRQCGSAVYKDSDN